MNDSKQTVQPPKNLIRDGGDTPIDISIIIPNYNARDTLRECLETIYKNPPQCNFEIFVIDDFSKDDSYDMVRREFPDVYVSRNERNLNYARSNNRFFDLARGRYLYLLNNDTVMLPGALDKMVKFLDAHPNCGALGNKLLNEDGSIQASVKSLPCMGSGLFGWRSPITKLFPNNPFSRKHLLHLSQDMSKPFTAGYVSSASLMMSKEVMKKVGYLDYRLNYHVDADYCARVWEAGYDVYYLPDAVVIHLDHKGGTLANPLRRVKAVFEFHRGSFIYFQKHQMKSWFHPMTYFVIFGLACRFVLAITVQQSMELLLRCGVKLPRYSP